MRTEKDLAPYVASIVQAAGAVQMVQTTLRKRSYFVPVSRKAASSFIFLSSWWMLLTLRLSPPLKPWRGANRAVSG